MTYAANTDVSVEKSRAELERTLDRYGASAFGYFAEPGRAVIMFEANDRRIRFVLPLPSKDEKRFTHTPARGTVRTAAQALEAWDEALRDLGRTDVLGIELDDAACATRRAAGLRTIVGDVADHDPDMFSDIDGLIASPPCQAFSSAGKGAARDLLPQLLDSIRRRAWGDRADLDPRVWLIVDLGRWVERACPDWFAFEQVPAVLPIWRAYAGLLEQRGYSTWCGILNAADFGVPQTRQRAILMASRTRCVHPPQPTHAESPGDALFAQRLPWVTMADALGWGMTERVLNTGRDWQPGGTRSDAQTITMESPAPAVTAKAGGQWMFDRPATTVMGDPRLGAPGHRDREGGERQFGTDTIRLTVRDALILQSFRPDYPVQGTKTKQLEQIGNAIPPGLARHILIAVGATVRSEVAA